MHACTVYIKVEIFKFLKIDGDILWLNSFIVKESVLRTENTLHTGNCHDNVQNVNTKLPLRGVSRDFFKVLSMS